MSEIVRINEFSNVRRGASPRPIEDPSFFGGNVGWVRISDVTASKKYLRKTEQYLSPKGVAASVLVKQGDIVMSICGTVGRPIMVDMDACIHDGFVQIYDIDEVIPEYLYYLLQFHERDFMALGQSGTQTNLNTTLVGGLKVFKPTVKAQETIVKVLASIDEQIELIEKLIEKKVALRNGTLVNFFSQQPEETLENIANVTMGQSPSSTTVSDDLAGGLPFLQGCAEFERRHPKPLKSCFGDGKKAPPKSVLISVRAPVGDTNIADREYVIGRGLAAIFPKNEIDPDYLAFAIEFSKQKLKRVAQGSTFEAVGSQDILGLRINFHPNPSERNKVSNILNSISGDIENNIAMLEKLKLQKQGLMQDLLTGRVRAN